MKLFTVGPVEMSRNILEISGQQPPYFRTDEFSKKMLECDIKLKQLIGASKDCKSVYLTASGSGAMEAVVINCFNSDDKVLVISGGNFGQRFQKICQIHGIPHDICYIGQEEDLTSDHLKKYENNNYTALLVNLHETSLGKLYSIKLLSEFCKRKHIYLIVDAISTIFADNYHMENYGIDVTIFSSQKALALSPGISLIVLGKQICEERIYPGKAKTLYFNLKNYIQNFERGQTPFTPAVGILLELFSQIDQIAKAGIDNQIERTKQLAEYFRSNAMKMGLAIPSYQKSNALTPLLFKNNAYQTFEILKNEYEIMVTPSGGDYKNKLLRIGHLGDLTTNDYDELLSAITQIKHIL